jgi:hypothetical protein
VSNLLGGLTALRRRALSLSAVAIIVILGILYLLFYSTSLEPALSLRSSAASELATEQKALEGVKGKPPDNPAVLQKRLESLQSTLTASASYFLTESEANQDLAVLYQAASASGVVITGLQAQKPAPDTPTTTPTLLKPSPTPQASPASTGTVQATLKPAPTERPTPTATSPGRSVVTVTSLRLDAVGTSRQLVDFISRLKGRFTKGVVISRVSITNGESIASLTMNISLYITTIDQ